MFEPPGCSFIGFTPNCYAIDIEEIASRFNLEMYFTSAYYVLSNGPNWEDSSIMSIFGVIFGQNVGI